MKKTLHFIFFSLLFFSGSLFSWSDTGHMVIAKLAEKHLTPQAKENIEYLLSPFYEAFPQNPSFVQAATFADEIRERGVLGKEWHKALKVYNVNNFLSQKQKKLIESSWEDIGVNYAIGQGIKGLKNLDTSRLEKGISIAYLIHCFGDLHMPHHVTSAYSKKFPKGDDWGVSYIIYYQGEQVPLHIFWDMGLGLFHPYKERAFNRLDQRIPHPLTETDLLYIQTIADELEALYPYDALMETESGKCLDRKKWIDEAHQIAIDYGYNGIRFGQEASKEYIERGREAASKQIAYAAYRLADFLNTFFSDKEE